LEAIEVTFEEEEDPREEMARICTDYGLDPGEIAPETLQRLTLLAGSVVRMRSESARQEAVTAVQRKLHEQMANLVFQKIDALNEALKQAKTKPEEIESLLVGVMQTMDKLAERLDPTDDKDSAYWKRIMERFDTVIETKTKAGREAGRIFNRVMDQYGDFIEDEIVTRRIKQMMARGGSASMEKVIKEIYGQTKEEMEEIKARNRERVVDEMEKMADEPHVTTEMLIKLYGINNRGIAPKSMSRLRQKEGEFVGFGRRLGTMPEDVAEEMKDWESRVAETIDKSLVEGWTDARYELAVAQLHNDLLEIHPFPDRNGSTSVMFMELMMMRRGYKPPKKRERNYYLNITKILGYNPAAVGLVGYEMRRQSKEYGYFAGRTTKGKENLYEILIKLAHKGKYEGKMAVANPFEV
jgi:molecular chaperone GrpE (heat shock protein)